MFLPAVGQGQGDGMINLKIDTKKKKRQASPKMVSNKFRILPTRHYRNANLPVEILERMQPEEGQTPSRGGSVPKGNVKSPMRHSSSDFQMLFPSVTNENIFYVFCVLVFLFSTEV